MTKDELIKTVSAKTGESQVRTRRTLEAIITAIGNELRAGNDMRVDGLGVFHIVDKKARKGVNPQTREAITVPAMSVIRFRPYKPLADAVR